MGFIKFLKKKNDTKPVEQTDSMEEPPAPPNLDMPTYPDEFQDMPTDLPPEPMDEDFPPPHPEESLDDSLPDFPEVKEQPYQVPVPVVPIDEDEHEFSEDNSFMSEQDIIKEVNETKVDVEDDYGVPQEQMQRRPISGALFIKADNFQRVLGRINTTKKVLKDFEDKVYAQNEEYSKEDKKYDLWKNKLEDVQRKLIYVDKALFEKVM